MIRETPIWTWIIPAKDSSGLAEWKAHGGKWLLYGSREEMERLAGEIDKEVQKGRIVSAKYWNASETSAMCIYSLDRDSQMTLKILEDLGCTPISWEYDYNRRKNWTQPKFFLSALYKLRILLKTFGVVGTIEFIIGSYS